MWPGRHYLILIGQSIYDWLHWIIPHKIQILFLLYISPISTLPLRRLSSFNINRRLSNFNISHTNSFKLSLTINSKHNAWLKSTTEKISLQRIPTRYNYRERKRERERCISLPQSQIFHLISFPFSWLSWHTNKHISMMFPYRECCHIDPAWSQLVTSWTTIKVICVKDPTNVCTIGLPTSLWLLLSHFTLKTEQNPNNCKAMSHCVILSLVYNPSISDWNFFMLILFGPIL
jgi:hypothetical protein